MGGKMEEWMDTDSLLGRSGMEPALWSPRARAWRAAAWGPTSPWWPPSGLRTGSPGWAQASASRNWRDGSQKREGTLCMQAVFSLNLCPCANVALFQECCVQQTEQTEVRSFLNLKLPSSTLDLVEYVKVWPMVFYWICCGDMFYFLISINVN